MMNVGVPELSIILLLTLLAMGVFLIPWIFYLLTLSKALNRCSPANRSMSPGQVWLLLIPLFNGHR